jgi:hypothetical protein
VGLEIFCSFFPGTKQAPGWYDRKRKAINSGDKSPRGGMKKARAPCLQGVAPRRGYCVLGKRPRGAQNKCLARCYTNGARQRARLINLLQCYSCAVARHKISVVVISVPGRHCVIRESPRVPLFLARHQISVVVCGRPTLCRPRYPPRSEIAQLEPDGNPLRPATRRRVARCRLWQQHGAAGWHHGTRDALRLAFARPRRCGHPALRRCRRRSRAWPAGNTAARNRKNPPLSVKAPRAHSGRASDQRDTSGTL